MTKFALLVAVGSLLGGLACGKSDKPADNAGPTQPAAGQPTTGAAMTGAPGAPGKAVPGTGGLHALLAGAGKKAAPTKGSLGGLGGMLGGVGHGGQAGGGVGADTAGAMGAKTEAPAGEGATGAKPAGEEEKAPVAVKIPPAPKGGDCNAVGKRIGDLIRAEAEAELAGEDEATRQMAQAMMEQMVGEFPKAMTQMCVAAGWTQELRDCILTSDVDALDACDKYITPEMQAKMDAAGALLGDDKDDDEGGAAPEGNQDYTPKGPPPKWDGVKNDCDAVGDQLAALATWQVSGNPATAESAKMFAGPLKEQTAALCKSQNWSEAARVCVLKAESMDGTSACESLLPGGGGN